MSTERYAYVLTLDGKYWARLIQRCKDGLATHVFVRKSQVAPKQAQQLLFYVTKKSQIMGSADFLERLTGDSLELWQKFGGETCFESQEEFEAFVGGRGKVTFIRFSNLREIGSPVSKQELAKMLGSLSRFRLGRYLDRETAAGLV
jgi:hypothetical protein